MPRLRRYVSATVPAIGCDIAKSRRADSGDPAGIGADRCVCLSLWLQSRQAEEASRLIGDVVEVDQATTLADDVEKIAMFAGGGVSLMCS